MAPNGTSNSQVSHRCIAILQQTSIRFSLLYRERPSILIPLAWSTPKTAMSRRMQGKKNGWPSSLPLRKLSLSIASSTHTSPLSAICSSTSPSAQLCFMQSAFLSKCLFIRPSLLFCISPPRTSCTCHPSLVKLLSRVLIACCSYTSYWVCQGCILTGLWVLAHECGHGGFSPSDLVNDIVGSICHSFLLVPYWSWKFSHAKVLVPRRSILASVTVVFSITRTPETCRVTKFLFLVRARRAG